MLQDGLYEQVINNAINAELAETGKHFETLPIDGAEAPKVLAKYVSDIVERALENLHDQHRNLDDQIELVNQLVQTILQQARQFGESPQTATGQSVAHPGEQLLALYDKQDSILALDERTRIVRPQTSIAQTSLFTGSVHEPQM